MAGPRLTAERRAHDLDDLSSGQVSRQGAYFTEHDFDLVHAWYARRLGLELAGEYENRGDCVLLTKARLAPPMEHYLAVLLCRLGPGTRVAIRENLKLWP